MEYYNNFGLKIHLKVTLLACIVLINACASLQTTSISDNENYVEAFPQVRISDIGQSITKDIFKIGDIADVSVYNVEALSNTYVIDRAGNISFPLLGTIQVAGLTPTQLQETLTKQYGSKYLRTPGINVKLESKEIGRVVVDGAVNEPGVFAVSEIIRLSEAIALAAGLNNTNTNGAKTFIVREVEGQRKVTEIDLRTIRKHGGFDPQIIPNDVIFVQDSSSRILFKEFLRTIPLLNTAILYSRR